MMKFIKDFIHFKSIGYSCWTSFRGALLCREYDRKDKNGR